MMKLPMREVHKPSEQFPFKLYNTLELEHFTLYRDNKFTKEMINNRHDMKMTKYNNAGYGYQIFFGQKNIGSIWLLNQVNSKTTYVRVSRYESYAHGYFIAVLSELSDMLESKGYSLLLKHKLNTHNGFWIRTLSVKSPKQVTTNVVRMIEVKTLVL